MSTDSRTHSEDDNQETESPPTVVEPSPRRRGSYIHVANAPESIREVVASIHSLSHEHRARAAQAAHSLAYNGVYSSAPFVGSDWWVPNIETAADDEPCIRCSLQDGVSLRLCGYKVSFKLHSFLLRLVLLALLWLAGWTLIDSTQFERGGYVFDPALTIFLAAVLGSAVCRFFGIPAIVGCMWVGIIWNNIPEVEYFTSGIVPQVRKVSSNLGLAVILTRAGLSVSVKQLKAAYLNTISFSILPFMAEATFHALVAQALFNHENYTWAFLQGFLASAAAPGVIVPPVLSLQQKGFGTKSGPNMLLLSSVVEDLILGIWGINFLVGLIFDKDKDLALAIAMGPIQVIGGVLLGLLQGLFYAFVCSILLQNEAKLLPGSIPTPANTSRANFLLSWFILFSAVATLGLGSYLEVAGGGAFAVMVGAATVGHIWSKDQVQIDIARKQEVGYFFAFAWDSIVMPALFSMSGSNVVLANIFNGDFFWRSFLCLLVGMAGRVVASPLCTFGLNYTKKEMLFLGLAWLGKGPAQGALGGLAYIKAKAKIDDGDDSAAAKRELDSAVIVRDTAVLAVLIGAPVSAVCAVKLGPYLLRQDVELEESAPIPEAEELEEKNSDPINDE